jgi:hypothetical protein
MARQLILTWNALTLDLLNYSATGLLITSKDTGAPTYREYVIDLPTQDASEDFTQYLSQRVVTMQGIAGPVKLMGGPSGSTILRQQAFDNLVPFLDPKARCTLTYADNDTDVVRMITNLRASQWSRTIDNPVTANFQVQWKADPMVLGQAVNQVANIPFNEVPVASEYPYTMTAAMWTTTGTAPGLVTVTNHGTYNAWPTYYLYGPANWPTIQTYNPNTGNVSGHIGVFLNVAAGDYLIVNTRNRTVVRNSDQSNQYSMLDFTYSVWNPLQVGANWVRYFGDGAAPASATVLWQDTYLT